MLIFESDVLKVTSRDDTSDTKSGSVLLSFTGIGHGMGGINVQKPEFFGTGRVFDNVIFITDKTRSWGNLLDFDLIKELVLPFTGDRHVYSIGNSMGGFNAIISTAYVRTRKCISFVPQFSVSPSVVPWETRWGEYISKISEYMYVSVEGFMNDTTDYFVFSGRIGKDFEHAKLFPVKDNVHHYAFIGTSHNVASALKERRLLDKAVQCCLSEDHQLTIDFDHLKLSPLVS